MHIHTLTHTKISQNVKTKVSLLKFAWFLIVPDEDFRVRKTLWLDLRIIGKWLHINSVFIYTHRLFHSVPIQALRYTGFTLHVSKLWLLCEDMTSDQTTCENQSWRMKSSGLIIKFIMRPLKQSFLLPLSMDPLGSTETFPAPVPPWTTWSPCEQPCCLTSLSSYLGFLKNLDFWLFLPLETLFLASELWYSSGFFMLCRLPSVFCTASNLYWLPSLHLQSIEPLCQMGVALSKLPESTILPATSRKNSLWNLDDSRIPAGALQLDGYHDFMPGISDPEFQTPNSSYFPPF